MNKEDSRPVTSQEEQAANQVLVNEQLVTQVPKKVPTIKEDDFKVWVDGRSAVEICKATADAQWDGTPLKEDVVYHLRDVGGLPVYGLEPNRRTYKRALKMQTACHFQGMTTPAVIVRSELARDWGLKLVDQATGDVVGDDKIPGSYVILEGHGRFYGYLLDAAIASKSPDDYHAFDFKFVFEEYDSPRAFGEAYLSTNEAMTRTTNKDRLKIAGARCSNPLVQRFNALIREGVIAKAAYFRVYGRELSPSEVNAITKEQSDAPKFDATLTDALAKVYDGFKSQFSSPGAEKIYRGVATAKWSASLINEAKDKAAMAVAICEKLNAMSNDVYTGILTAKGSSKRHQTRDQVIMNLLDQMMK